MTGSSTWASPDEADVWANGDPWAGGLVLPSSFAEESPYVGAFLSTGENGRVLIDVPSFFKAYLTYPSTWHPENTNGRTPYIVREEELRRLSFTNADIITIREDESEFEPVNIQYDYKNEMSRVIFRMWTRHSRDQAVRLPKELERALDQIRIDPFGLLPGEAGRSWFKITEVTREERTTRLYWYRELRLELNRRFRRIEDS